MKRIPQYRPWAESRAESSLDGCKQLRLIVGGLLACALVFFSACQKAPLKPLNITSNDVCFYCKAPITEIQYAAEFVSKDGFVRKFDDLACLIKNAGKVGKKNIAAFYAMDYPTKQWLAAEEAVFVRSQKFKTPKDGGIIAFKDPSQAQALATRYQAELVKFDDLVK